MTATQRWTATVLAGLVVVAVAVLAWLVRDQGDPGPAVTTAESSEASIASAEVKAAVRDAAAKAAATAYSYSWDTLGEDREAARALMTRDMQRRYDRTMAGVGTSSRRLHTVATAEVVDTAVVTASASYARVLRVRQPEHVRRRPRQADARPRPGARDAAERGRRLADRRARCALSPDGEWHDPCGHTSRTEGSRRGRRDDGPADHRSRPDRLYSAYYAGFRG